MCFITTMYSLKKLCSVQYKYRLYSSISLCSVVMVAYSQRTLTDYKSTDMLPVCILFFLMALTLSS
jgi:hypothetical protein